MELEIQKFLRAGNAPETLTEKYGIKIATHGRYPNLKLFKYSQIESPMGEPIVQEARGLILDAADNWKVICWSYRKFFNHGEGHAAKVDMSTAKVMDKLDGSLMQLYYYGGVWNVSSSGMPDAAGQVNTLLGETSFAELFWQTWKALGYKLPQDTSRCYAYEMMTQYNRIICVYGEPRIALHGVRDLDTLQELEPEPIAALHGWECVKSLRMNSLDDVIEMANRLDPMAEEGYVVVDANFNRIKLKNPQYVALSHIKEGMSLRRMVEIVRTNESEEFLAYFPEFEKLYREVREKYNALVVEIEAVYEEHKDIAVQKDFALAIKDKPYSGVLFGLRGKKCDNVRQALQETQPDKLAEMLGLR